MANALLPGKSTRFKGNQKEFQGKQFSVKGKVTEKPNENIMKIDLLKVNRLQAKLENSRNHSSSFLGEARKTLFW